MLSLTNQTCACEPATPEQRALAQPWLIAWFTWKGLMVLSCGAVFLLHWLESPLVPHKVLLHWIPNAFIIDCGVTYLCFSKLERLRGGDLIRLRCSSLTRLVLLLLFELSLWR